MIEAPGALIPNGQVVDEVVDYVVDAITVRNVITGEPGSDAAMTLTKTEVGNYVLDITIPAGPQGIKGFTGAQPEVRIDAGVLQWRPIFEDDPVEWTDLIDLSAYLTASEAAQAFAEAARDAAEQHKTDAAVSATTASSAAGSALSFSDDASDSASAAAGSASTAAGAAVQTVSDANATAADRVATGADATATAADRAQTGLDRTAADASANAAEQSAMNAAAFDPSSYYDKTTSDGRYATAAQGGLAATALQPSDAAAFATAAQGGKADTAVQPGSLSSVATSGAYGDLDGKPTLGSAAATNISSYATAAQGVLADAALPKAGGVLTGNVSVTKVDKGTVSTGTVTFDVQSCSVQRLQVGGALTIALSTKPAGYWEVWIELINGGAFMLTMPDATWLKPDGTRGTAVADTGKTLQASGSNWIVFSATGSGTVEAGIL